MLLAVEYRTRIPTTRTVLYGTDAVPTKFIVNEMFALFGTANVVLRDDFPLFNS